MCGAVCIVYYQAALALRGAAAHRASLDLLVIEQQVSSQPAAAVSQSVSHMHFGHLALPVKSPPALAGMQSSSMIQGLTISRFYHSLTGGQILNPPLKLRFVVPKPNFESNSNPLFSRTPTYLFFTNFPLYKAPFGSTQYRQYYFQFFFLTFGGGITKNIFHHHVRPWSIQWTLKLVDLTNRAFPLNIKICTTTISFFTAKLTTINMEMVNITNVL